MKKIILITAVVFALAACTPVEGGNTIEGMIPLAVGALLASAVL